MPEPVIRFQSRKPARVRRRLAYKGHKRRIHNIPIESANGDRKRLIRLRLRVGGGVFGRNGKGHKACGRRVFRRHAHEPIEKTKKKIGMATEKPRDIHTPMSLIPRRPARRMAPPTCRCASPKHPVLLLLPINLHRIPLLLLHIHTIPPIGIPLGPSIVIMAWYPYICEPLCLGGAEHGVEHGKGAPVREKVALGVVRMGLSAKVDL